MRSEIPSTTRQAVLSRAKDRCECCGEERPLELHHLTYNLARITDRPEDFGDSIFGRETPDVLRALCRECHLAEHVDLNGDFWADPEEKEDYWWSYWNELEKD